MKADKIRKFLVCVISALLILALLTSCAGFSGGVTKNIDAVGNLKIDTDRFFEDEFVTVLENGGYKLLYKDSTAEIALFDKNQEITWYSNPQDRANDEVAAGNAANLLNSQVEVSYFVKDSVMEKMDSHSFSTVFKQHAYQVKDDRLKVTYKFGQDEFNMNYIPQAVSKERMKKFFENMSQEEIEEIEYRYQYYDIEETDDNLKPQLIQDFPLIKKTPLYIRTASIPEYIGEEIYEIFKNAGYTREDLIADNEENQLDIEIDDSTIITLSIVYNLTNQGFSVTVPSQSIDYKNSTPVTDIVVLPYFGCGGNQDKGYIVLPDGSGSVMNFNNGKVLTESYSQKIYDRNMALSHQNLAPDTQLALLPIFGVSNGNNGFIASIDSGFETAYVQGSVSGITTSYNNVCASFSLNAYDQVSAGGEGSAENTKYYFPQQHNKNDMTINYMTTGPSYSEMANTYREHLIGKNVLSKKKSGQSTLNLELIGTTLEKKVFLGIKYEALGAVTTYKQALEILNELDIDNTDIKLEKSLTGGQYQYRADKAKPLGILGNQKELETLQNKSNKLYFALDIQTANKAPKNMKARGLDKDVIKAYSYDKISRYYNYNQRFKVLISPYQFLDMTSDISKNFKQKGVKSLAIGDISYQINSDYNQTKQADPKTVLEKTQETFNTLSKDFSLSAEQGGLHVLPFVDKVWNIPDSHSYFSMVDYSVPFYQIVVHGYVDYCLPAVNNAANSKKAMLRAIEYGAQLQYSLLYENVKKPVDDNMRYFNKNYKNYVDEIKDFYPKSKKALDATVGKAIVSHRRINDNLSAVTYDDNTVIVVNYGDKEFEYENVTVGPLSFEIIKGGSL